MHCSYKTTKTSIILFILFILGSLSTSASEGNLPLLKENIIRIEQPPEIQYNSALIQEKGLNILVYESWDGYHVRKGNLHYSQVDMSKEKTKFTPPKVVSAHKNAKIRTSVSQVTINNDEWLYYIESNSYKSEAIAYRAKLVDGSLVEQQTLSLGMPISPASNARWHVVDGNKVGLVYREKLCCKLYFSISNNGIDFGEFSYIGNAGSMPYLSSFKDGKLLYLFQKGFKTSKTKANGEPIFIMKSHFRMSSDMGKTWGDPHTLDLKHLSAAKFHLNYCLSLILPGDFVYRFQL
ncbi:hypothetical protein LZP73_05505 [Shewanella sp. AS16]|uniref:hypothetical protein n=1 Tax=Shewanella sp. AS16 TaxID=2907625 RepID=UPI001F3BDB08|nr:hypothetical protein [Shewanella sp. AS16]MCE9685671.1 hypothetical protein [Shewanella sp. AS16]